MWSSHVMGITHQLKLKTLNSASVDCRTRVGLRLGCMRRYRHQHNRTDYKYLCDALISALHGASTAWTGTGTSLAWNWCAPVWTSWRKISLVFCLAKWRMYVCHFWPHTVHTVIFSPDIIRRADPKLGQQTFGRRLLENGTEIFCLFLA